MARKSGREDQCGSFNHLVASGLEVSQEEIDFPTLRQDRTCSKEGLSTPLGRDEINKIDGETVIIVVNVWER